MELIDLTQQMTAGMPAFPGTPPPTFGRTATIEGDGFEERLVSITTHTGTHVDAPSHVIDGAATVDSLPLSTFWGPAALLDASSSAGATIAAGELEAGGGNLAGSDFALIRTGWSVRWGSDDYFRGHRGLSAEAARWLSGFRLKGIGIDAPSVDAPGAAGLPVHRILLGRGMVILENLARLDKLPMARFLLACFPLPLAGADGSPARVVAIVA